MNKIYELHAQTTTRHTDVLKRGTKEECWEAFKKLALSSSGLFELKEVDPDGEK